MLEIKLEARSCECCGGTDLELLWGSQSTVVRAKNTWKFPFRVAVCRNCGFCFASPGPNSEDLAKYHSEGLAGNKEIGLPYALEARLTVLERYRMPHGVFAEIGGDEPGDFHKRCAEFFGEQLIVEIAEDTPAKYRSVHELEENSVDVLAHYDVLEHVVEVRDFLTACHRALRPGGVMVCEVPNIRLYPRNLLLLEFEHVNHFSPFTLNSISRQVGFNLVEFGHLCSRPYSFLSVFRKEEVRKASSIDLSCEFTDAVACVQGGLDKIRQVEVEIDALRQRILQLGEGEKKITLWGVTDLLRRLLDGFSLPNTAKIVDTDPRRESHLSEEGIRVFEPKDCLDHVLDSDLLVICAARYKSKILSWIKSEGGKTFANDIIALGTGPSGETLT